MHTRQLAFHILDLVLLALNGLSLFLVLRSGQTQLLLNWALGLVEQLLLDFELFFELFLDRADVLCAL